MYAHFLWIWPRFLMTAIFKFWPNCMHCNKGRRKERPLFDLPEKLIESSFDFAAAPYLRHLPKNTNCHVRFSFLLQFEVHRQQKIRALLWEMLQPHRTQMGRDLQRLRPFGQEIHEIARGVNPTLASRRRRPLRARDQVPRPEQEAEQWQQQQQQQQIRQQQQRQRPRHAREDQQKARVPE